MAKFPTMNIIKHAAYETYNNGYTKRSEDSSEECTADLILDALLDHSVSDTDLEKMNDRIRAWSEYIKSQDDDNEYFKNVKSEMVKPMIDESKVGLIASSFSSFDKYNKFKLANEKDKLSEFLGEEGDSVRITVEEYKLVKTGISKFGKGNKWYLYKLKDSSGNIITLFSNENLDKEFIKFKTISATISKLSEYNGIKQTQITKVTFE
jgi:uncharacterized membrane protein YkoI